MQGRAFAPSADARLTSIDSSNGTVLSQRVFDEGGSDFCFVSRATDDPVLPSHRVRTPFVRKVLRRKHRDDGTLMHQHNERMSNPQLPKMGVFVIGSGAAGEVGLADLEFEVNAFVNPTRR